MFYFLAPHKAGVDNPSHVCNEGVCNTVLTKCLTPIDSASKR
jgi:hypothetical protein